MIGARVKGVYSDEAKKRKADGQRKGGKAKNNLVVNLPPSTIAKARDQAAAAVSVSGSSIDHAATVLAKGTPELVAAVDAGKGSRGAPPSAAERAGGQ